jgi:DNA-binding IclR family transcriptional regulator
VYLGYQDCNSGLRLGLGGGIGRRVPANCTACGKALLAALAPAALEARLPAGGPLPGMTPKSVTDRAKLLKELARIRKSGYSVDEEETMAGLSCVGVAIASSHADGGYVAVSISAATSTLNPSRRQAIRTALDSIAESLRERL